MNLAPDKRALMERLCLTLSFLKAAEFSEHETIEVCCNVIIKLFTKRIRSDEDNLPALDHNCDELARQIKRAVRANIDDFQTDGNA